MIIRITRGEDFATIDNDGEVFRKVQVSGNNDAIVKSLGSILNTQTGIRFKGELDSIDPELIIREGTKPAEVNKALDLYITKYFIGELKLQGFEVKIIKE